MNWYQSQSCDMPDIYSPPSQWGPFYCGSPPSDLSSPGSSDLMGSFPGDVVATSSQEDFSDPWWLQDSEAFLPYSTPLESPTLPEPSSVSHPYHAAQMNHMSHMWPPTMPGVSSAIYPSPTAEMNHTSQYASPHSSLIASTSVEPPTMSCLSSAIHPSPMAEMNHTSQYASPHPSLIASTSVEPPTMSCLSSAIHPSPTAEMNHTSQYASPHPSLITSTSVEPSTMPCLSSATHPSPMAEMNHTNHMWPPTMPGLSSATHPSPTAEMSHTSQVEPPTAPGPSPATYPSPTAEVDSNPPNHVECGWIHHGARCGRQFSDIRWLLAHLRKAHGARVTPGNPLLTCHWCEGTEELRSCNASFRNGNLKRHIEAHLGTSHKCSQCEKSYSRTDTLRLHIAQYHP